MIVKNYRDVEAMKVLEEGARKATVRWVINENEGAENFLMRVFEIEPGGCTPSHQHPWEHEMFVFGGQGCVVKEGGEVPIAEGSVIFIAPDEKHQITNTSKMTLKLICLVPSKAMKAYQR